MAKRKKLSDQKEALVIKRYRLAVSNMFPATHPRKGEPTYFHKKIILAIMKSENEGLSIKATAPTGERLWPKLHTIRANYELWKKRISEVQKGVAVIELFHWKGVPYRSKQVVFATLDKDSECVVQEIFFLRGEICDPIIGGDDITSISELSRNDGLSLEDFKTWFKGYDLTKPMAIIQLTKFRY